MIEIIPLRSQILSNSLHFVREKRLIATRIASESLQITKTANERIIRYVKMNKIQFEFCISRSQLKISYTLFIRFLSNSFTSLHYSSVLDQKKSTEAFGKRFSILHNTSHFYHYSYSLFCFIVLCIVYRVFFYWCVQLPPLLFE